VLPTAAAAAAQAHPLLLERKRLLVVPALLRLHQQTTRHTDKSAHQTNRWLQHAPT
jgi:hypothetical protein